MLNTQLKNHYPRPAFYSCGLSQPPQNETVPDLLLKTVESLFPLRGNRRGLYVHGAHMPAQRLVQDVIDVVAFLLPTRDGITNFQRYRFALPNILNSRTHYLLRINLQHFRRKVGICGTRPHVPETIQPPSRAMFCSIRQRLLLVKVHQQWRAPKCFEPDINQFFLIVERGHVRTPALSPIPHGRNIHAIEKWIPVITLPASATNSPQYFRNSGSL